MKQSPQSAHAPLLIALVLGVGLSLGGCATQPADSGGTSNSSQEDPGTPSDGDNSGTSDGDSSQGFVDEDGDVPDWVAAGFPIYPGSVAAGSGEAGDLTIISFSVPDVGSDGQELYAWFVDQYSQNGWSTSGLDDEHMSFEASNTDGRTASLNITKATYVMSVSKG